MNFPFEQDPEFVKLPYSDQQQLRLKYAAKVFGSDGEFQKLSQNDQLLLMQKVASLSPAFENPKVAEQFQQMARNPVVALTFLNANRQSSIQAVASKIAGAVVPEAEVTRQAMWGADAAKGQAWLQTLVDGAQGLSPILKMLPTVGNVGGVIADLASFAAGTHLLPTKLAAAGLKEIGGRATSQLARWAISDLAPTALRAAGQGATGVLRENLLRSVNGEAGMSAAELAKTFGTYAAGDTLFWNALSLGGPFLRLAGKTLLSFGKSSRKVSESLYIVENGKKRALNAGEMATYEDAMLRGDLPPTLLETASPSVQDHLNAVRERQFYGAHPEIAQADPYGKTVLAAGSIGLDVVKVEGGYRVRHIGDPGASFTVPTLGKLDESLLSYLRARKDFFDLDELRADPLRGHLVAMMDAQDGIEAALKGARPPGAKPSFISLEKRASMSPLEAESAKASAFSGAGQTSVADTFHIPLSEEALSKLQKEKRLFPQGADAVPLSKEGGVANVFVQAAKVAPKQEVEAAQVLAKKALAAGSTETEANLTATFLRRASYDGADLPEGAFLALYPERQIKVLDNTLSPASGRSGAFRAPVTKKMPEVTVSLASLKGKVPDSVLQGNNVLLSTLLRDSTKAENVARGASLILKRLGAKDSRAAVTVLKDATEVTVRKTAQGLRVFLPEGKDVVSQLPLALSRHVAEEGSASRKIKEIEANVTLPEDRRNLSNLRAWFSNLQEQDPHVGAWVKKNAAGLPPEEALKKFALSTMTPQEAKAEMAVFGVRIVGGEGKLKALKGGKVIASGKTPQELLDSTGIVLPKLPASLAPKVVELLPDGVVFEAKGISVRGGPRDIWKLLDSFDNYAQTAAGKKIASGSEGAVVWEAAKRYRVEMPGWGVSHLVSSLDTAREYIARKWKEWGSLSERIEAAGGVLRHENGKYVVHLAGTRTEAASLRELQKVLKDLPESKVMPDLVGADSAAYFQEGAPLLDFQAWRPRYTIDPPKVENPNFFSKLSMMVKPMEAWITNYAQKIGAIEALRNYHDMQAGVRLAMRDTDLIVELLDDIVRPGGKLMKAQQREGLFYLLGEINKEKRASIIEQFHLGEAELGAEVRLRAMLGESASDSKGLFAKFGFDPWKFIYGYMSRIRQATDDASILHLNQPEATEEILNRAFGKDSVPNEIHFWAENMRSSDVISFALDTDVYSVMRRYITRGHLRMYVGEPWRKMVAYLNTPNADKILRWRTFRYMDMLQGGGFTDGEKMMQHFSSSFLQALGKKNAAVEAQHHDVMRTLYSLSYTAHLGWRPFTAIRNLMQMYQTVGPLIGNSYLQEAIQFVSSKKGEGFLQGLRRMGVLHQAPPLVNQLADGEHVLHRVSSSALSMFKTADDLTRAVGYRAAMRRFEDAQKAFPVVEVANSRKFAEYLGSNLFGPEVNSRVLEAALAGKMDLARHTFANAAQERALFLMRREQSPVAFHGVVGKMFGQYGTFAANYVQFVRQTWKYATPAQKAAFAARWIGNSAAMAASMYAIGLRGKDFLPWSPAQFTGGPLFNLAIDMLHSVGNDYQARQARGELNRMLPVDLNKLVRGEGFELQPPVGMLGYYQIRQLMQMSQYASQGDPWKVFLALMSAPIRSE